ncbi:MAG: hypothetical protein ACE5E6_01025 [Phycisphaerae bacterium]
MGGPPHRVADLTALSAALDRYSPGADGERPVRRGNGGLVLPLTAALLAGLACLVGTSATYICRATIELDGDVAPRTLATLEQNLFYAAARDLHDDRDVNPMPDCPTPNPAGAVCVCATTTRRERGRATLQATAERFVAARASAIAAARANPSRGEEVIARYTRDLRARLDAAEAEADAALARLPAPDVRTRRDALRAQWGALRQGFTAAREALKHATAALAELAARPEPTRGIVPTERRRDALEADATLQQDLAELAVELTELKLLLLNVWQHAAEPLDALTAAAGRLSDACSSETATLPTQLEQLQFKRIASDTQRYVELVAGFRAAWATEFAAVRRTDDDPYTATLMDAHQRIRALLRDFLMASGDRLGHIRRYVKAMREGVGHDAKYHVLYSTLVRRFEAVQAAHRRFEFAASGVEPTDSFKIDTALRRGRGLRRRTRRAIAAITDRLERDAVERARRQHRERIAAMEQRVAALRVEAGEHIDRIVALQDDLNLTADLTEDFLERVLHAELASVRKDDMAQFLAATETELDGLKHARLADLDRCRLGAVSCAVVGPPLNQSRRFLFGGAVALIALVCVGVGQRWIARGA